MQGPKESPSRIAALDVPKTFEEKILLDGVSFIFEGSIQNRPQAYLALRLPNSEIERLSASGSVPADVKKDGVIGFIGGIESKTSDSDFDITIVRSYAKRLAVPQYRDVHVGRFLMNNLIALADKKKWRLAATPGADTLHGSMDDADITKWFQRSGFEFQAGSAYAVRQPREPDAAQPIIEILAR